MAQGPEVPKAQIKLRELVASRARNGYHPDGSSAPGGPFPLPNSYKKDKYSNGTRRPIPKTTTTRNDYRGRNV